MQPDTKFNETLDFLIETLRKSQIPKEAWVSVIADYTEASVTPDAVKVAISEFPDDGDIGNKFDTSSLKKALESEVAGGNEVTLSVGELQAASMQTQLLLSCRRYYGRRKTPRSLRIIHAAHRRAILTHPKGPLSRQLRRAVEILLSESR